MKHFGYEGGLDKPMSWDRVLDKLPCRSRRKIKLPAAIAGRTPWIVAVAATPRHPNPGCGTHGWPRSGRCSPARLDRAVSRRLKQSAIRLEIASSHDLLLEGDGFEPSVPDEGKATHASVTFDRFWRLPRRSDSCARRPVAIAIRADAVVGGTRYSANLQCHTLE